jgi:hypothetical protein
MDRLVGIWCCSTLAMAAPLGEGKMWVPGKETLTRGSVQSQGAALVAHQTSYDHDPLRGTQ